MQPMPYLSQLKTLKGTRTGNESIYVVISRFAFCLAVTKSLLTVFNAYIFLFWISLFDTQVGIVIHKCGMTQWNRIFVILMHHIFVSL